MATGQPRRHSAAADVFPRGAAVAVEIAGFDIESSSFGLRGAGALFASASEGASSKATNLRTDEGWEMKGANSSLSTTPGAMAEANNQTPSRMPRDPP